MRKSISINRSHKSHGFTMVELMIASTVFAVVLIIAQTSFVQIGHLFYRGISITNTQEVADHLYQDISGNFQNAPAFEVGNSGGYKFYCIGNTRYTYRIDNEIDTSKAQDHSATTGNFGVLKDTVPGSGTQCPTPCDDAAASCPSNAPLKNPVELLGDKMRIEQFDINQPLTTSNLYTIDIIVAYGDSDTLDYGGPGDVNISCKAEAHTNFCAVSSVHTSIFRGRQQ